jgi:hypothetical protein
MTESDTDPREPTRAEDPLPFGDFEIETETMPDGRRIHYYRWPDAEPPRDADPDASDV